MQSIMTWLTAASLRRPLRFLGAAFLVVVVSVWLGSKLELRSNLDELLPADFPSVAHARELAQRVGGDGTVYVNVEALDGEEGFERAAALADTLADEMRALGPDVVRAVESNVTPVASYYADHWPLFLSVEELRGARDRAAAEIERARARMNPFDLGLDEEPAAPKTDDPLLDPEKASPRAQVLERFRRFRGGHLAHPDGRSVLLVVRPAGTALGVEEARALVDKLRVIAARHDPKLRAERLRVGFAGSLPIYIAEYEAIIRDVFSTFALVMALVMASLFVYFRQARPVLALGVVTLVGVAVTFGFTRLTIGYLNTQTAFLGCIVAGNGINYGLIYLARATRLRRQGASLEAACHEGARVSVLGTLVAALASAVSYGTLVVAANRGFRHFGIIGGIGLLFVWAATFALLPAVLWVFERIHPYRPSYAPDRSPAGRLAELTLRRPRTIIAGFAVATLICSGLFVRALPGLVERDLDKLSNDPTGSADLRRDQDRANASLGKSGAGVIALLPSVPAAERYCEVVHERRRDPQVAGLVEGCESLSTVVPLQQAEKLAVIEDILRLLKDDVIKRLPAAQAARVEQLRRDLSAARPVTVVDAPATLLDRFRERDGTVGRVVFVRARGDARLEDGARLAQFVAAVSHVPVDGKAWDPAGASVILADLLSDIEREGPLTTALSLAGVCALVVLGFRLRFGGPLVLTSLVSGVALAAGIATATGIRINFLNFIVFPITFGIAADYGVNVLTRMNARRDVRVGLAEVGGVVALCSWTTIVGYGSLLLSINRALRSFGWYAILGEVTTLASALALLPALALVFPPRGWKDSPAPPAEDAP